MRSNAVEKYAGCKQDNFKVIEKLWEARRARIAIVAEQACQLPGNINGPDLDYLEEKYRICSFA